MAVRVPRGRVGRLLSGPGGMSSPLLDSEGSRRLDRWAQEELGVRPLVLMENVGGAVARLAASRFSLSRGDLVVVLCGKGNNGGDGLVAARHLKAMGMEPVCVLAFSPGDGRLPEEVSVNLEAASRCGIELIPSVEISDGELMDLLEGSSLAVDALLGVGFRGVPRGEVARLIRALGESSALVLSVDVPSGVDPDDGSTRGPFVRAHATATAGLPKVGLLVEPGASAAGEVFVLDLGIPISPFLEAWRAEGMALGLDFVALSLGERVPNSSKGDYGKLLIVGGARCYAGSVAMAARAAYEAGVGLVRVACPPSVRAAVNSFAPEAVVYELPEDEEGFLRAEGLERALELARTSDAVVLGPGMGRTRGVDALVEGFLLGYRGKLILDADGINALADLLRSRPDLRPASSDFGITPHPGEMGRLLGMSPAEVQSARLRSAREALNRLGGSVLLKGSRTIVVSKGILAVVPLGNPGMATAGMGDVLAGVCGAFAAWCMDVCRALCCGAYVHALAGDLVADLEGMDGVTASKVVEAIATAVRGAREGFEEEQEGRLG